MNLDENPEFKKSVLSGGKYLNEHVLDLRL